MCGGGDRRLTKETKKCVINTSKTMYTSMVSTINVQDPSMYERDRPWCDQLPLQWCKETILSNVTLATNIDRSRYIENGHWQWLQQWDREWHNGPRFECLISRVWSVPKTRLHVCMCSTRDTTLTTARASKTSQHLGHINRIENPWSGTWKSRWRLSGQHLTCSNTWSMARHTSTDEATTTWTSTAKRWARDRDRERRLWKRLRASSRTLLDSKRASDDIIGHRERWHRRRQRHLIRIDGRNDTELELAHGY